MEPTSMTVSEKLIVEQDMQSKVVLERELLSL